MVFISQKMTESNDEEIDLLVQEDFDFDERSERSFLRQPSLSNTYIRDDEYTYTSKSVKKFSFSAN